MEVGLSERLGSLIQAIAPRSTLRRAWPLAGGISAAMTAFEIETPDGELRRLILRRPSLQALARNPNAASDEFNVLRAVRAAGLAVPRADTLDQDGSFGFGPCLVIDYVEGQVDFAPADPAGYVAQMARQLALIHSLEASGPEWPRLPPSRLAGELDFGAAPAGAFPTREVREALQAAGAPVARNAPALLHGDFWPGNVLWRAGQLAAVIDWEDAARGDPLADLAISRLDVLCLFGREAMQAYTQQYVSQAAVDDAALPYWDACAALRLARLAEADLAGWAAFFGPFGRPDISEHSLRAHYGYFVEQAIQKCIER